MFPLPCLQLYTEEGENTAKLHQDPMQHRRECTLGKLVAQAKDTCHVLMVPALELLPESKGLGWWTDRLGMKP